MCGQRIQGAGSSRLQTHIKGNGYGLEPLWRRSYEGYFWNLVEKITPTAMDGELFDAGALSLKSLRGTLVGEEQHPRQGVHDRTIGGDRRFFSWDG